MIIIIILTVMLVAFTIVMSYGMGILTVSNLINFIFLLIMSGGLMIITALFVRKIETITKDLKNESLCVLNKNVNSVKHANFFSSKFLNEQYKAYETTVKRNDADDTSVDSDISDYINISILNFKIRKPILDNVGASLTALGLLGTFIGLIWGLRDFSTDYDAMQTSISNLLIGIRTAFMTSIYGVVFSLYFNMEYRSKYIKMKTELENFHKTYYKNIQNSAEYNTNKRMVDTNSQLLSTLKEIGGDITKQFDQSMIKMSEAVNASVSDMNNAVTTAIMNQENCLETLVDKYVEKNNAILKEEISEFRKSIENINNSNASYCGRIAELADEVEKSTNRLSATVGNMDKYLENIGIYQREITEANDKLVENMSALTVRYDEQNDITTDISEKVKTLTDKIDEICYQINIFSGNVSDSEIRVKKYTEETESYIQTIQASSNQFSSSVIDVIDTITEKVTDVSASNLLVTKELKDFANQDIKESMEKLTKEFSDIANRLDENYNTLSNNLSTELTESLSEFEKTVTAIIEKFSDIIENINKSAENIPYKLNMAIEDEFRKQRRQRELLYASAGRDNSKADAEESNTLTENEIIVSEDEDYSETFVLIDESEDDNEFDEELNEEQF